MALQLTTPSDPDRDRRLLALATYCLAHEDLERAEELLAQVLGHGPSGAAMATALLRLARIRADRGAFLAAGALLDQAEREAGDDVALRVRIAHDRGWVAFSSGNPAIAGPVAEALDQAERVGLHDTVPMLAAQLLFLEFQAGRGIREDLLDRYTTAGHAALTSPLAPASALAAGIALTLADDFDRARPLLEQAHDHAVHAARSTTSRWCSSGWPTSR